MLTKKQPTRKTASKGEKKPNKEKLNKGTPAKEIKLTRETVKEDS